MATITNSAGLQVEVEENDIHRIGGMHGVYAIYMQDGSTHFTTFSFETLLDKFPNYARERYGE